MKKLEDLPNVETPSATFPYGNLINNTGTNNGTRVNRDLVSDLVQFAQKLADEAGISMNNEFDNELNGWQLFQSFQSNITKKFTKEVTSDFDGEVVSITRTALEAAFTEVNPFYSGSFASGTTTEPFIDFQIQVWYLSSGSWKNMPITETVGEGAIISVSDSTGDISVTLSLPPVSALRTRIVLIG